jgi:tetratricopeptide (TPR) repeat protein
MPGIFISYRRTDSDHAVLLYAWLKERFGADRVFWDKEDIQPGQSFADVLRNRVRSADALVALIGRDWMSVTDAQGRRRLESPEDWVRIEIASALDAKLLVLPVLATGVEAPMASDLPPDLEPLAGVQALSMSDARFHNLLLSTLEKSVPVDGRNSARPDETSAKAGEILRCMLARLQIRAVELIQENKLDRALDELNEGFYFSMLLGELVPRDLRIDLQLAYIYKDFARALLEAGDAARADRYSDLAFSTFDRVVHEADHYNASASDLASAINGIANVYYQSGDLEKAIQYYHRAISLVPDYAYAWHDLFAAHDMRARAGNVNLPAMEEALAKVRETGFGLPGLSAEYIAGLEQRLAFWRAGSAPKPPRTRRKRGRS